jgi:2-polyprenyl-6-methoxyphenol hydroxylase-like FAD-dependent oxidoreductase
VDVHEATTTKRHGVVIGASMAGLLTARVLADRLDWVTIIERDALPDGPEARKGVPQGRHAHGLLPSGEAVIRDLFPGLMEELVAGGAQRVAMATGRWWQGGGYRIAAPGAQDGTFLSRPFLERGVRARVERLPNVAIVAAAAKRLAVESERVRGVEVAWPDGTSGSIAADLVVDTSGRGSQASGWLEDLGYPAPPVDAVRIDMGYATRIYRRTPGRRPEGTWYVTIGDPKVTKRFGVAFPIEGDRWLITVGGSHGDHPSASDESAHLDFVRSLPTGDIAGIVLDEEPLGPIVAHRLPSSQWRRYDKVDRHPPGFLALGDSICSFNPAYGQGMSSAAQQACALADVLDAADDIGSASLPKAFYRRAAKVIANPWAIAAGGDFAHAETTGAKPAGTDVINRYVGRVVVAAQHDVAVAEALWDVQGLLAPPPSLMKPATALRVFRFSRRGPTGSATPMPAVPAPAAVTVASGSAAG